MLVAVTSEGPSLDARIDQRFGRCRYFLIVNTEDLGFEAIENANVALGGGAGIQSAQMIADKGVARVYTGACGPNAFQVLAAAGIEVVSGCSGNVRDVIDQSREGRVAAAAGPSVADHYGMGQGFPAQTGAEMNAPGMGRGGGMGRGMGMRCGGGSRRGMGGAGAFAGQSAGIRNTQEDAGDELEALKRQMGQISERIRQLEKEKDRGGKG